MPTPTVPDPDSEDFDKFLEWTEEEAFLDILKQQAAKNLPKDE